ncbi:hypothetical protein, partial [Burkholderia sp.]|uniref:hypothetical protein n=1 Tax=Burkholderia sp. TaxID=36773 RepID=UPI00258CB877
EQRTENPRVGGSIPSLATKFFSNASCRLMAVRVGFKGRLLAVPDSRTGSYVELALSQSHINQQLMRVSTRF